MNEILKFPFLRYLNYCRKKIKVESKFKNLDVGYFSTVDGNCLFEEYVSIYKYSQVFNAAIGSHTYIGDYCRIANCSIGRYCSIANNVVISPGQHPINTYVSTSPIFYTRDMPQYTFADKEYFDYWGEKVEIGNDVWIGNNVHIMQGVKIGDGAIIASNAVVTKDVSPYSIVGGIPAKEIKKRFSKEVEEKLLKLKWWNIDRGFLQQNFQLFHHTDNIDEIFKKWNEENEKN